MFYKCVTNKIGNKMLTLTKSSTHTFLSVQKHNVLFVHILVMHT